MTTAPAAVIPGSRPSDGPGSLNGYIGQQGLGVWMLTEVDDSLTQTGAVNSFTMTIQPHQDLTQGVTNHRSAGSSWFYDYIDVPPGATNLTVYRHKLTATCHIRRSNCLSNSARNRRRTVLMGWRCINNPGPIGPWGSVSLGPPLTSGRYFVGLYNPSPTRHADGLSSLPRLACRLRRRRRFTVPRTRPSRFWMTR